MYCVHVRANRLVEDPSCTNGSGGEEFRTTERRGDDLQQRRNVGLESSRGDIVKGVGEVVVDEIEVTRIALSDDKSQPVIHPNTEHTYSRAGGIKFVDSVDIDTWLDRVGAEHLSGGIDDQLEGSGR